MPARTEGGHGDLIERILAAADRQERRRDEVEDPFYGEHIGWGYDSPTTTERRRNGMRHPDGRSVHTSEVIEILQGRSPRGRRSRDRSSRDRSSRDRSSRDRSSKGEERHKL